jgi:uncharacterized metal-binding protein YceD (DUF177 family)
MPGASKDGGRWSVPVRVEDIPETGAHFDLVAPPEVRADVVATAELVALPRLEAVFDAKRRGRGGAQVVGRVSADVGQTCVVSLEPMESRIDEPVDVIFVPPSAAASESLEEVVSPHGDDPPEMLYDGKLDLGALALEFLLLAIDPYPRKPDAVFAAPPTTDGDDASSHPFAALAALTKNESGKR